MKPQYVDQIPKAVKGLDRSVGALLKSRSQMNNTEEILDVLGTYINSDSKQLLTWSRIAASLRSRHREAFGW